MIALVSAVESPESDETDGVHETESNEAPEDVGFRRRRRPRLRQTRLRDVWIGARAGSWDGDVGIEESGGGGVDLRGSEDGLLLALQPLYCLKTNPPSWFVGENGSERNTDSERAR